MKIKHTQTGDVKTISRKNWESPTSIYKSTRQLWEIEDQGDPVVLCQVALGNSPEKELYLIDRNEALSIIKKDSTRFFYKEYFEAKLKPKVPIGLENTQSTLEGLSGIRMPEKTSIPPELGKKITEFVKKESGSSPIAKLSDEILLFLLEKRKTDSSLKFWLRRNNRNNRLNEGFWFRGADYIHIGFSNIGDGNSIQSIGFVIVWNKKGEMEPYIEISFIQEEDPLSLNCYKDIVYALGDKMVDGKKRYHINRKKSTWRDSLIEFLTHSKPVIDGVIEKHKLTKEFEIPDEDFEKSLDRVIRKRKELGYEPIKINNVTDKSASLWSDTDSEIDELGRELLVNQVVKSIDVLFDNPSFKESYTLLLDGEWGSGKSSMLNFFKKEYEEKSACIIEYNAWKTNPSKNLGGF